MIYSTNWIERLNRDYKRVLKMRGAMPTAESVIALMGTVAMEKENTTYSYSISVFKNIEELKIRDEKYTLFWTLPAPLEKYGIVYLQR